MWKSVQIKSSGEQQEEDKEKQQILTFERLEQGNVLYFS